jgi:ABC-type glutathione transport system ATPase component
MSRRHSPPAPPPTLLSFEDATSRCADGGVRELTLLDRVSFELAPAQTMGVYGARRSGKSTLLRLAAGLQLADSGGVRFAGRDHRQLSARARARLLRGPIALLCADDWGGPGARETVLDHVATGAGSDGLSLRHARRRAMHALSAVDAAALAAEDVAAGALSAAERARAMLARAIVREPTLLLVDEPAPLPSLSERERFCALLRSLAREREIALLVASEELSCLQGLDVLASLSGGQLCSTAGAAGSPGPGAAVNVVELARRRA